MLFFADTHLDIVIANTCIVVQGTDHWVSRIMRSRNYKGQLYYAKQTSELRKENQYDFNIISNEGTFGFKTYKSERILFRNRRNGLLAAINQAFNLVVLEE